MAAPTLTYSFSNGSTADATQVNQNFTDLLNGYTDGTKDLSISALTCAGTLTANGHVNLGNSSSDDLTITASLAASIPIKTTNTYDVGSATKGLAGVYFGTGDTDTARIVSASLAASRTYTLPDAGAAADFLMTAGTQTVTGTKTWSSGSVPHLTSAWTGALLSGTYTPSVGSITNISAATAGVAQFIRIGNVCTVAGKLTSLDPTSGSTTTICDLTLPFASNFGASTDAGGTFVKDDATSGKLPGFIYADAASDRVRFEFTASTDAGDRVAYYTFTYLII